MLLQNETLVVSGAVDFNFYGAPDGSTVLWFEKDGGE